MKTLNYSDKVKKASVIYNAIVGLSIDQEVSISYNGKTYKVSAYDSYNGKMSYSVWSGHRGMNVSKVGKTSLTLYSFDMMDQKTTYRMSLLDATLLPESK
jgi:hypothetical protein